MTDCILKSVESKNGELHEVHRGVLGCRCNIRDDLALGKRAVITYEPKDAPGSQLVLTTSPVENFMVHDNEAATLETENTIYVFEAVED